MSSATRKPTQAKSVNLMVRLDEVGKKTIERAAAQRRLTTSDYVRTVLVPQADRELRAAESNTIALSPAEQIAFWQALNAPAKLTSEQKELGQIM
ncbi:MAG: DUF1778 domain-containing protein [Wenzhouxiangella sp.]|nr:DUF1778 domain-containing protein [Wenzhouxiangella sp.]